MSLKHKNTSKWAKKQEAYAKYNDKARELVQDQLELSKKLTKKIKQFEVTNDDDEDDANENDQEANRNKDTLNGVNINPAIANNPWLKMMQGVGGSNANENDEKKNSNNKDDEYSQPKAFVDTKELEKAKSAQNEDEDDDEDDQDHHEDIIDRSELKQVAEIFQEEEKSDNDETEKPSLVKKSNKKEGKEKKKKKVTIKEPEKEQKSEPERTKETVNIKPINDDSKFKLEITEDAKNHHQRRLNEKEHHLTLSEAFADDDIVEEFRTEKVTIKI